MSIMPPKRRKRRRRRRQRPQAGEGINTVIAGIPKAAWSITKGVEKLAKKNYLRSTKKRMEEKRSGKRKRWAGESFTCNLM